MKDALFSFSIAAMNALSAIVYVETPWVCIVAAALLSGFCLCLGVWQLYKLRQGNE